MPVKMDKIIRESELNTFSKLWTIEEVINEMYIRDYEEKVKDKEKEKEKIKDKDEELEKEKHKEWLKKLRIKA